MDGEKLFFHLLIKKIFIKDNGFQEKCMVKVFLFGRIDHNMKEVITKIEKKGMEYLLMHQVKYIKVIGKKVNKMVQEYYMINQVLLAKKEYGKMEYTKKNQMIYNGNKLIVNTKVSLLIKKKFCNKKDNQ